MENVTETCLTCDDDISDSKQEWYCSDKCKRENETYNPTGPGPTKEQEEDSLGWIDLA